MRLLIAEDDGVSRMVLKKALEDMGYTVHATKDGAEAWEAFQRERFPLIISDWMMPQMDGIELCRMVRSLTDSGYTYFILLTARDSREDRFRAIEAGADDFLSKPLDRAELSSRLSVARRILDTEQRLRDAKEDLELKTRLLEDSQKIIEQARRRAHELFEKMPVACFTFDAEGNIGEWNHAATQLYGWQDHEVLEVSMFDLITTEENRQTLAKSVQRVMRGEENITDESVDQCRNGNTRHVLHFMFPLHGPCGEVIEGICASVDITQRVEYERELRALNERLQSLAYTDALTGLYNHRAFQDKLAEYFAAARRGEQSFALMLADIDYFKRFNDTYGHQVGDEVLKMVARVLRDNAPPHSIVARYGGEEFAVLLSGCSLREAISLAEKLRRAVTEVPNPYRQITASFGVAKYMPYMHSPSEVVEVADGALYEAKRDGRNCVRPLVAEGGERAA